jgi:ATP-binding cassette, subfamily B, bacterial CvaB/MchF/RaxB
VLVVFVLYTAVCSIGARAWSAVIEAKAYENSTCIETLRAIKNLKIFNHESDRETRWLNHYADVVSAAGSLKRSRS